MSGSEVAMFSLSRFQLRTIKDRFKPAHRKIKRLLGDPGGLLITILVANEVVNISISTIIAGVVSREWAMFPVGLLSGIVPEWAVQTVVGILMTAPVLLLCGEITPKAIAVRSNQLVAPLTAMPLSFVYDGLKPVRLVLKRIVGAVSRRAGGAPTHLNDSDGSKPLLREEEFIFMVEEGHKEGAIRESELELIKNVFELDDRRISDVYTPLLQVYSIPSHTPIKTAVAAMRSNLHSRIPVTGVNRKQVVGVLYAKDLLLARISEDGENSTVATLMRKPYVVQPNLRLNALFRKFKQNRTHIAIVEKDPGEALGIVTMADVLEELLDTMLPDEETGETP